MLEKLSLFRWGANEISHTESKKEVAQTFYFRARLRNSQVSHATSEPI